MLSFDGSSQKFVNFHKKTAFGEGKKLERGIVNFTSNQKGSVENVNKLNIFLEM